MREAGEVASIVFTWPPNPKAVLTVRGLFRAQVLFETALFRSIVKVQEHSFSAVPTTAPNSR